MQTSTQLSWVRRRKEKERWEEKKAQAYGVDSLVFSSWSFICSLQRCVITPHTARLIGSLTMKTIESIIPGLSAGWYKRWQSEISLPHHTVISLYVFFFFKNLEVFTHIDHLQLFATLNFLSLFFYLFFFVLLCLQCVFLQFQRVHQGWVKINRIRFLGSWIVNNN